MSASDPANLDPLMVQGLAWVRRIRTEGLDEAAASELARWRGQGAAEEKAFQEAEAIGRMARSIGREILAERVASDTVVPFPPRRPMSRRLFLGSAIAASAAGVLVVGRSTDLFGRRSDFATGKAERRTVALARGLEVTLDAQTEVDVTRTASGHHIELLGGRAEIEAALGQTSTLTLRAGKGTMSARNARYDVRLDDGEACVSCLGGSVEFAYAEKRLSLGSGQQVRYDDGKLQPVSQVDPDMISSWRKGLLVFHQAPLSEVVREVNRYRHGRIVLARSVTGSHPVSGVFHIDRMDQAVAQIEQITGARAVSVGDYVLLT